MSAPEPYWADDRVTLHLGDCLDILPSLEAGSVDAVVTDPPAGIAFMGREWDDFRRARNPADVGRDDVFGRTSARGPEYGRGERRAFVEWLTAVMAEATRVMKPGAHALVWSIPRTSHWTAWAIEDAGLEIRDCIPHLFGSGFPKSLDVSKAIDKAGVWDSDFDDVRAWLRVKVKAKGLSHKQIDRALGNENSHLASHYLGTSQPMLPNWDQWVIIKALLDVDEDIDRPPKVIGFERAIVGYRKVHAGVAFTSDGPTEVPVTAPATEDAARWEGWGTALKPGQELWWLARKPFRETVAANVLEHGTGALNIDGCKVAHASAADRAESEGKNQHTGYANGSDRMGAHGIYGTAGVQRPDYDGSAGRWPTNILFTHSAACVQVGTRLMAGDSRAGQKPGTRPGGFADIGAERGSERPNGTLHGDESVPVFQCAADCPVAELDRQSGISKSSGGINGGKLGVRVYGAFDNEVIGQNAGGLGDIGGASRFYPVFKYAAKAPASERPRLPDGTAHETVKSLDLMRWLVRLITPPGGLVLDFFAGSGTTGEACIIEGFRCVLIEKNPASVGLIRTRLRKPIQPDIFGGVA